MIDYIEWIRAAREIPREDQSDFYDQPLPCTTIYQYQTSRFSLPAHRSHFSLKFTLAGQEDYCFARRRVKLGSGKALFSNEGGEHDSSVQDHAHALSIYLPTATADMLTGDAKSNAIEALDDPELHAPNHDIPEIAFMPSARTQHILTSFLKHCPSKSVLEDNEALQSLSWQLTEQALRDIFEEVPFWSLQSVAKSNVRDELITRVLKARDYLNDTGGAGYDLDTLASIACLSPFHLLRTFSDVVGETPGSYARGCRLKRAEAMLAAGADWQTVARKAGYQSVRRFKDALMKQKFRPATAHLPEN